MFVNVLQSCNMNNCKIPDFIDVVNYITTFSPNVALIKDDLINNYKELIEEKKFNISLQNIKILQNDLKLFPKYISIIIEAFKTELSDHDSNIFINFYEDTFIDLAKSIESNNNYSVDNLLCLLLFIQIKTVENVDKYYQIYDHLINLVKVNKLEVHNIYLTLLSQNKLQNVQDFLNYDLNNSSDYYYKYLNKMFLSNVHWVIDIINGFKKNEISSAELMSTLNGKLLHLIMLSISDEEISVNYFHPLEKLFNLLEKTKDKDTFIYNYCKELYRKITIARFCYENSLTDKEHLFQNIHRKSLLCLLNSICRLQDFQHERIISMLQTNRNLQLNSFIRSNLWEEDLYTSYVIVISCAQAILPINKPNQSMETFLKDVDNLYYQLNSMKLRLKVLRYMFSILFLKFGDVSWNEFTDDIEEYNLVSKKKENFLCSKNFLEYYLPSLRKFIDITKSKFLQSPQNDESCMYKEELNEISEYVENAFWRQDILSPCNNGFKKIYARAIMDCSLNEPTKTRSYPDQCINMLLSPPTSLVNQCLLQNDFKRSHDVIKRYHIEHSFEAKRANFFKAYLELKSRLRKLSNRKMEVYYNVDCLQSDSSEPSSSRSIVKIFLDSNKVPFSTEDSDVLNTYKKSNPIIKFYDHDQNQNMILLDLLFTSCSDFNISANLVSMVNELTWNEESPLKIYLNKVLEFFIVWKEHNYSNNKNLNTISIMDIIMNEYFPNDINTFKKILEFNEDLGNLMPNLEHDSRNTEESFKQAMIILANNPYASYINSSVKCDFLKQLWEYLQKLNALIQFGSNYVNELNIFNFLNIPLEKIIGDLVHKRGNLPNKIEKVTNSMNINLFEILVMGLTEDVCPLASINENRYTFNDEIYDNSKPLSKYELNYKPDVVVIAYLRKHNWLIAYLIEKLYNLSTNDDNNINLLRNIFNLERTQLLMPIYEGNVVKTSLNYLIDIHLLNKYFEEQNVENENLLNIFLAIPTIQMKQSTYLRNKKMTLLQELSKFNWKYIQFLDNIDLQYDCVNENILNWDEKSLKLTLEYITEHIRFNDLTLEKQQFLRDKFNKILMFEKVSFYLADYNWNKFQNLSEENIITILETLLMNKQIELSLEWINLYCISREQLSYINEDFLSEALQVDSKNMLAISKFLHELNTNQALQICEKSLLHVNNINSFKVFGQFILHHENTIVDYNLIISINILMGLETGDCISLFKIIMQPLLIIEQYLMNCKFDKLTKCLKIIKKKLLDEDKIETNTITMIQIEKLLINYAKQSLRFDVPNTAKHFPNNEDLIQPIETPMDEVFSMPLVAPKKSEWVPNESANECMCCKQSIFTMFNRRHHCRRCGRVVCGLCSMNRLKLSAYKDLNVRVCNQCYDQTKTLEGFSSDSYTSDEISSTSSKRDYNPSVSENISDDNEWVLSGDLERDNAVREEFGYTHAPSVSLCLSILSLHNDSEEAPNFLLSECEAVIRIMKPKIVGIPNNEIDYSLLIEIMRSMAIAAKVKFSHLIQLKTNLKSETSSTSDATENKNTSYYYAGISRCDYILNYADLASLLVQHGCEGLLTQTMEAYDIQILREQLMLSERWTVALEVSLKAGLDKSSVFAAWGKTCLRAGAFLTAREKFSHCLKAVHNSSETSSIQEPDIFTVENFMEEKYSKNVFKYSTDNHNSLRTSISKTSKNTRPSKDPTLLNEIIDILEKATYTIDASIQKNFEDIKQSQESLLQKKLGSHLRNNLPEPPLYILHTLSNLKNITNGIYESEVDSDKAKQKIKRPKPIKSDSILTQSQENQEIHTLEKFIFDECKYYLKTYGSHEGIIRFYMQHSTINQVLEYILNNTIDKNIFTEFVYMECLKTGTIEVLYHHMSSFDSTLLIWKDYLSNTCRYLEKYKYMHTLFSLQLFMKDLVRASMTCIHFYTFNCTSYTNLHENVEHLNTAEKFLKQELEAAVTSTSSTFQVLKEASAAASGFIKKLSYRELDRHINTICKQREVAKFLAECEIHGRSTFVKLNKMFANDSNESKSSQLPTLFGSQLDRLQVATLIILCGQNVEEGFGLAFRIAQDYQLQGPQLYRECARYLARCGNGLNQVAQLCRCVHSSGLSQQKAAVLVDELAAAALYEASILHSSKSLDGADAVVRSVSDIGVMISCYINIRQLKSAYLLAVKHDRIVDVRRIQREAEKLGQTHVIALCTKRLNM